MSSSLIIGIASIAIIALVFAAVLNTPRQPRKPNLLGKPVKLRIDANGVTEIE